MLAFARRLRPRECPNQLLSPRPISAVSLTNFQNPTNALIDGEFKHHVSDILPTLFVLVNMVKTL
jgi:hypothetical protein